MIAKVVLLATLVAACASLPRKGKHRNHSLRDVPANGEGAIEPDINDGIIDINDGNYDDIYDSMNDTDTPIDMPQIDEDCIEDDKKQNDKKPDGGGSEIGQAITKMIKSVLQHAKEIVIAGKAFIMNKVKQIKESFADLKQKIIAKQISDAQAQLTEEKLLEDLLNLVEDVKSQIDQNKRKLSSGTQSGDGKFVDKTGNAITSMVKNIVVGARGGKGRRGFMKKRFEKIKNKIKEIREKRKKKRQEKKDKNGSGSDSSSDSGSDSGFPKDGDVDYGDVDESGWPSTDRRSARRRSYEGPCPVGTVRQNYGCVNLREPVPISENYIGSY